ncbi:MAG: MBL fold metallo-hydrolase [Candidatus Helarchaeota archaeon]
MIPLTDKIFFIEGKNHGRYTFSNSLFIKDDKKLIIDTGVGKSILRKIRKNHLINDEIIILHSHCHEDHIFGNHIFKQKKIGIHHSEAYILRDIKKLTALYGSDDPKFDEMNENFYAVFDLRNYDVDIEFEDGHVFELGDTKLQVIHTPGHSGGHCSFYEPNEKIIFLGDIDLSSFGPWYGDISSNVTDFINSINKIIQINPKIAVSSHKGVYQEGIIEELKKFLDKIYEREEQILEFLKSKHTLNEIVKKAFIYGKIPEPYEMFEICEMIMVKLHLERLISAKKIEENPKNSFIAI